MAQVQWVNADVPCCLFPFGVLSLPEADFIQFSEEGVGDVLLVAILRPQQELHPLGRRVCCSEAERTAWSQREGGGMKGDEEQAMRKCN